MRLTKKDKAFVWGEDQSAAFKKIKVVIFQTILLTYMSPSHPFDVFPDAANKHVMGTMLVQDGKVILTFSQKFNDAQL